MFISDPEYGTRCSTVVTIARDGTISTEQGVRGRIGVVAFENPQTLNPIGDSLWEAAEAPVSAFPGNGQQRAALAEIAALKTEVAKLQAEVAS